MENIDQKNQNSEYPEEESPTSLYSQLNSENLSQHYLNNYLTIPLIYI
ncbi:MAG: hypothetical protein U5L10_00745 [Candidatus Moranbacteria bacterium]|nr:hypothetical protein [Candidatus Moranbacteria bacterium]